MIAYVAVDRFMTKKGIWNSYGLHPFVTHSKFLIFSLYNDKGLKKQTCSPPFPKILIGLMSMLKCFKYLMTFKISWIGNLSTFFSKDFSFRRRMPAGVFCLKKVKTRSEVKMNPWESSAPIWGGFYYVCSLKSLSKISKWASLLPRKLKIEIFKICVAFLRRTSWTGISFLWEIFPPKLQMTEEMLCISLVRNLLDNQHWWEPKSP